jgi:nitrile hydratase beta subunit
MNGGHDLGGVHGLGPIQAEAEGAEPVFHADWERRVFGMVRALGALGRWNGDMSRYARERQHPADYLRHSYYENWLGGLEKLLVETGLVTAAEVAAGEATGLPDMSLRERRLTAENASQALAGTPATLPIADAPRFQPGDRVRALNRHPQGHTREPRYVRGRTGIIHEHHGGHVFPDLSVQGVRASRHLYTVRFEAKELWGPDGDPRSVVFLDLWEDYLEPV